MPSDVLFVSPRPEDAAALSQMLRPFSISLEHVEDLQNARASLEQGRFPVVLTEARLPDGSWLDVLRLAERLPAACVIVTDAQADVEFWGEAMNLGAYDVLAQPFAASEVTRILSNACAKASAAAAVTAAL